MDWTNNLDVKEATWSTKGIGLSIAESRPINRDSGID